MIYTQPRRIGRRARPRSEAERGPQPPRPSLPHSSRSGRHARRTVTSALVVARLLRGMTSAPHRQSLDSAVAARAQPFPGSQVAGPLARRIGPGPNDSHPKHGVPPRFARGCLGCARGHRGEKRSPPLPPTTNSLGASQPVDIDPVPSKRTPAREPRPWAPCLPQAGQCQVAVGSMEISDHDANLTHPGPTEPRAPQQET